MTTLALFEAHSVYPVRAPVIWAESAVEADGSDAATLDGVIRALHAHVPAHGSKNATADELALALNVPVANRDELRAAFRSAEVHADGRARVTLSEAVRYSIGDNTIILGPVLHAKIHSDKLEITTGFALKVGFAKPKVRSVERGEQGGQRGIHVRTSMGSRFLPF